MKIKPLVFALCLLVVCAFTAPPAWALATATSEATIDWSSLTITLSSGMTLTWKDIGSQSEAAAYHNSVLMDSQAAGSFDWGATSATATYSIPNGSATGTASTTADTLQASTSASSDLGGRFDASAHGWGANRWGSFTVSGGGTVLFSVDYSWSITLNETRPRPQEVTSANPAAALYLERIGWGSTNVVKEIWYPEWDPPLNGTLSESGTLTVSLWFGDGEEGYFTAGVSALSGANSVPEPGTLLLLGSGLAGVATWARRRTRSITLWQPKNQGCRT